MNPAMARHAAFASALRDPMQLPAGLRGRRGGATRFAVHRNNVTLALVDALAAAFPVTRALLGEECFGAIARDCARADPPRSPVMAEYGAGFADFIAPHARAAGIGYLVDVARLERLHVEAFHAADAEVADATQWRAWLADPLRRATLRVRLQPACRWLSSAHPLLSIWQAHQYPAAQRDGLLRAVDLQAGEDVLVHRPQWDVQRTVLPPGGIAWLDALHAGGTLAEASLRACAANPRAAPAGLCMLLLQPGLVMAIDHDEEHAHG